MVYNPFSFDYMDFHYFDFDYPTKKECFKKHKKTCAKNKRKRKSLKKHKKTQH